MESPQGLAAAPAVSAAAPAAMPIGGIVTVAVVLAVFVLLACALVFLQYYFNHGDPTPPRPSERRRGGGAAAAGRRNRGVDPELLRSLPVTVYRAAKDPTEEGVECAVYLAELEDGEAARFLPKCGHGFHAQCVDQWLASHTTCPLCRLAVGTPAEPAKSAALPPVPPEPANYATTNLPASVLLGVTLSSDGGPRPADMLVIEIPETTTALPTPRGSAKSPGSARMRSLRRLWSYGRQGPSGSNPSCTCGGGGGGSGYDKADIEQGINATVGIRAAEVPPRSPVFDNCATPRTTMRPELLGHANFSS